MAKLRNFSSFGGFPALVAGCLLLLLFICLPFRAYAFTPTDANSFPLDVSLPSTAALYEYAEDHQCCILFLKSDSSDVYYIIIIRDNMYFDSTANYNFSYGGGKVYGWYQYYNFGFRDLTRIKLFSYNPSTDNDWVETSFPGSDKNNSVAYSTYIDTSGMRLYAVHTYIDMSSNGEPIMITVDPSNNSHPQTIFNLPMLYTFGSDGELSFNHEEPEPEPEYNGLLGQIITWLQQIKQSILDLPTNISGYFTTLSTNISGFFTNLGDLLISPFRAADATHQEGIVHKFFFTDIPTFFSNLGELIAAPFRAGDATHQEGIVHKFFFTDIPTFFSNLGNAILKPFRRGQPYDNYERGSFWLGLDSIGDFFINIGNRIYGFFVPDNSFWEQYNADWRTSLNYHFGGLIQAEDLILDIIGRPSEETNNNTRYYSKKPSRSPYSDTDRTYNGQADCSDETDSKRGGTKVQRRTLIQIFDFTEGTADYEFNIPNITLPTAITGTARPVVLIRGGTYNLFDLMNIGNSTNNFWDYWYMACNSLFFIWGCYHLKKMIDELIGKRDNYGDFDLGRLE